MSIGHTAADYDTALAAFQAGADHVTHLFNGMPPIHHRAPGVIMAALDSPGVRPEIICDGVHIPWQCDSRNISSDLGRPDDPDFRIPFGQRECRMENIRLEVR